MSCPQLDFPHRNNIAKTTAPHRAISKCLKHVECSQLQTCTVTNCQFSGQAASHIRKRVRTLTKYFFRRRKMSQKNKKTKPSNKNGQLFIELLKWRIWYARTSLLLMFLAEICTVEFSVHFVCGTTYTVETQSIAWHQKWCKYNIRYSTTYFLVNSQFFFSASSTLRRAQRHAAK